MEQRGRLSVSLLKISVVYLVLSLAIGLYMGISDNHALATVHSHIALLGWVTMALTGLIYLLLPACERHSLATVHYWLYNAGLPAMIAALAYLVLTGDTRVRPLLGAGSVTVLLALACFAVNVLRHGRVDTEAGEGR